MQSDFKMIPVYVIEEILSNALFWVVIKTTEKTIELSLNERQLDIIEYDFRKYGRIILNGDTHLVESLLIYKSPTQINRRQLQLIVPSDYDKEVPPTMTIHEFKKLQSEIWEDNNE